MNKEIETIIKDCKDHKRESLKLRNFELTEIPDGIFELTHLTSLDLMNNKIQKVSPKISQLTELKELWLTTNELESIPIEISELPKLKRLHLTENNFKNIPIELLSNKKISHLCMRENSIESLPAEIEKTLIRDIQLANNKISKIPMTFDNADFYLSLGLRGNPLEEPPSEIFHGDTATLFRYLIKKDRGRTFDFEFPNEIRTTFKQYLIYFSDFVKNTKGKYLEFEIRNVDNGLSVEIKTENNSEEEIAEIQKYMQEYVSFIKYKVDEVNPNFEIDIDDTTKQFTMVELRSQIRNFFTQLEIKQARIVSLEGDRDRYMEILQNFTSKPTVVNITNQNSSQSLLVQRNEFTNEIKNNLPNLIDQINELRSQLPDEHKFIISELKDIDQELLELEECEINDASIKKSTFKKLKRVLEQINDEDSELNKTLSASKKTIDAAQKIGSTYNNFAEWLGLPQIPRIFLGK